MRGRFAPSPTGRFHLGNARTALIAWLQVRHAGGQMVMRVEDLDPARSRAEHERAQLADLRWLGLDWDEGPDVGGERGPYRQSERGEIYRASAEQLAPYPCTCSRRELREAASAPHGAEPVYPGTCRRGPRAPERTPAWRWPVPDTEVCAHDLRLGELCQHLPSEVGDVLVRRSDGVWAYQLAVVVDDGAMGISQVCRGADLWTSTPRQVALQRALGLPTPGYLHVPLVLGPDGEKLSKRHGAPDLTALREGGADPGRVVAALARSAGLVAEDCERIDARSLISGFDPARLLQATHAVAWTQGARQA